VLLGHRCWITISLPAAAASPATAAVAAAAAAAGCAVGLAAGQVDSWKQVPAHVRGQQQQQQQQQPAQQVSTASLSPVMYHL
jgi:hypothetical protein